jgi:tripartite-type tricarboxylate transporter receptor subunit TctC
MLRALAVTAATRAHELPDIPTIAETVSGYEATVWYGIGVPRGTPTGVIDRLNKEINSILADPVMRGRLSGLGVDPMPLTAADFGKFVADETEKWRKVLRAANISAE